MKVFTPLSPTTSSVCGDLCVGDQHPKTENLPTGEAEVTTTGGPGTWALCPVGGGLLKQNISPFRGISQAQLRAQSWNV
jgi:hypothetical protein